MTAQTFTEAYSAGILCGVKALPPIARNIATLREATDLTQDEFAEKHGLNQAAISRWESGQAMPKAPTLVKLALIFKVSVDRLVLGVDADYDSLGQEATLPTGPINKKGVASPVTPSRGKTPASRTGGGNATGDAEARILQLERTVKIYRGALVRLSKTAANAKTLIDNTISGIEATSTGSARSRRRGND